LRRIAICATQVPFSHGGAEILVDSLADELRRRGFECDLVRLPFSWTTHLDVLKSALAWRLIDLRTLSGAPIDLVIATRFPAYLVRHPNKVVWLIHQFRQVYDLAGTPYSEYQGSPEDMATARRVRAMDERALPEARRLYSISANVSERLRRHNGIDSVPLYPPPKLGDACRQGDFGNYVLAVGRLDRLKRFHLLVEALARTATPVRAVIAGSGPEEASLRALAESRGVGERLDLPGFVSDAELLDLYAGALAVFYAPYDEDYGYVTVEAMQCGKPVLTTADSGGVLEFVTDGENGFVCPPGKSRALAGKIDRLFADRDLARRLGAAGRQRVAPIGWDRVIAELTGGLAP